MENLLHAFKAFVGKVQSSPCPEGVELPDRASLMQLLAGAAEQEEAQFAAQLRQFLQQLAGSLEPLYGASELFADAENFLKGFEPAIKGVDPLLARHIKEILSMQDQNNKNKALFDLLNNEKFSATLAMKLKAVLTPSHLNPEENIREIMKWALKSVGGDNERVADQGAYGENAWVRNLLRLLFTLVKMASAPALRSSVEKDNEHSEKARLIPNPAPRPA